MSIEIQYLHHSGFSVKTEKHFFVFDYEGTPKGYDRPVREENAFVFASHRHGDHYSKEVHRWKRENPALQLILSYDIPASGDCKAEPDTAFTVGDVEISTLRSTDEGVSFLVKADGVTIYHAGDLNWWHWNGEPDDYNAGMKRDYLREIETLRGEQIDLAFLPLDPRQEDAYSLGLDAFAKLLAPSVIFPMHFWDDHSVIGKLKGEAFAAAYADTVVPIREAGEVFLIGPKSRSSSRPDLG